MKNKLYLFCLSLIFCFNFSVYAQENAVKKWTRINFDDNEVSLSVPSGFVTDKTKQRFSRKYFISGFQNGVRMQITVYEVNDLRNRLFSQKLNRDNVGSVFEKNKLVVKVRSSDNSANRFSKSIVLESDKYTYFISVSSSNKSAPEIERFLYSIKVKGDELFVNKNAQKFDDENLSVSELKNSPEVDEAYLRDPDTKKNISVTNQLSDEDDDSLSFEKYTRPPILIEQAKLEFSSNFSGAAVNNSSYSAKLKISLLANGQVGDIIVLSNADKNFIKACVRAARKTRFVPAQIDGKNVDSETIISYSMQIFASRTIIR